MPSIELRPDGPIAVSGPFELKDAAGKDIVHAEVTVKLCRCGGSQNKPFCDGTHRRNGFSGARLADGSADKLERYEGKGFKTVIAAQASAKVSFRLVHKQDPVKIREAFREFVLSPELATRRSELRRTLDAWKRADLGAAAERVLPYLPAEARVRAKVYPVVKPRDNSFVFEADLRSRLATVMRIRERFLREVERKGVEYVVGGMRQILVDGERNARARLRDINDGIFRSVLFNDDHGTFFGLTRVPLTIIKEGEELAVLVQGVSRDANALGYFGFAYYVENKDKLKAVPIVNEKGQAVLPSLEAVEKGVYSPLARPIFIYVSTKSLAKPEVKQFVEYYMTHGAKLAKEVKYVPLPASAYTIAWKHVLENKKGTVFGGVAEVGVTIEELLRREAKL